MNIVASRTITGFCLNFEEWYYEGEIINVEVSKNTKFTGTITNGLIEAVSDDGSRIIIRKGENKYSIDSRFISKIQKVERRKLSVNEYLKLEMIS